MRACVAVQVLRFGTRCGALAIGALAAACGRIGYDPELVGVYGPVPDAAVERSDTTPDAGLTDVSSDASSSLDSNPESDAASMASDASDASDGKSQEAGGVCPTKFDVTNPRSTPLRGGSGGTPGTESCPPGQMIMGFVGSTGTDGFIDVLATTCVRYATVSSASTCVLAPTSSMLLGSHGDTLAPGRSWMMTCPVGQVVAGIRGRAMSALDQLAIECAPISVSNSGGTFRALVGSSSAQAAEGGTGGSPFDDPCPANKVASGINFRAGAFIDAFAILCSDLSPLP